MSQRKTSKAQRHPPTTLVVSFRLSDEARREYAFRTQRWLPTLACLKPPTRALDAETRRAFAQVPYQSKRPTVIPLRLPTCRATKYGCAPFVPDNGAAWKRLLAAYQQDEQQDVVTVQLKRDEELTTLPNDLCAQLAQPITARDPLIPALPQSYAGCAAYEDVMSLAAQVNAQITAARTAEAHARDLPRRQHEAEREDWIARHGSDALRGGVTDAKQRERTYLHKRARQEYPQYTPLSDSDYAASPCLDPDPAVQAEAKRVGGTVVWWVNVAWLRALADHPMSQDALDVSLAVEYQAVQIVPYLDIYTLVRLYPHRQRSCTDRVFFSREYLDPWRTQTRSPGTAHHPFACS